MTELPPDTPGEPAGPAPAPANPAARAPAARSGPGHGRSLVPLVRMRARRPDEPHRAATPLELFFDLCFVVAVAQAGARLVHAVAEGDTGHGVAGYLMVFFAIWWAWVNFTWFASAYDTDDVPYRLATFVQMSGVLVLAAGVPRAFDDGDFTVVVVGYLIMRLALTLQWLRAARGATGRARTAALRYARGLVAVQAAWVALLLLPEAVWVWGFVPLAIAELAVPAFAEHHNRTGWHPHHVAERYGLFTIIMLGETIAAATVAVQSAVDDSAAVDELLPIAVGGLLIVFAAFWVYFAVPIHEYLASSREALLWGYGHYLILGSAAGIGVGLEVAVEQATGHAHISTLAASFAVTVPTALFLLTTWAVHVRHFKRTRAQRLTLPVGALLVLGASFAGYAAVPLAGLAAAGTVAVGLTLSVVQGERTYEGGGEDRRGEGGGVGGPSAAVNWPGTRLPLAAQERVADGDIRGDGRAETRVSVLEAWGQGCLVWAETPSVKEYQRVAHPLLGRRSRTDARHGPARPHVGDIRQPAPAPEPARTLGLRRLVPRHAGPAARHRAGTPGTGTFTAALSVGRILP
jgi:low temperature requirement protein LtrA